MDEEEQESKMERSIIPSIVLNLQQWNTLFKDKKKAYFVFKFYQERGLLFCHLAGQFPSQYLARGSLWYTLHHLESSTQLLEIGYLPIHPFNHIHSLVSFG